MPLHRFTILFSPLKVALKRFYSYYINSRQAKTYSKWLSTVKIEQNKSDLTKTEYNPLISIIVPTYNTPITFLQEMVSSVLEQTYGNWELIIVDDASTLELVKSNIRRLAQLDKRIRVKFLKNNLHISGATNEGIKLAKGEFVSLLDHDDLLYKNALFEVVSALNVKDYDFIYSDEDKVIGKNNMRIQPFFKPGWNQDFLYSVNYITHFVTIKRTILLQVGLEDGGYNGAQDWELFLRLSRSIDSSRIRHINKVLYGWRVHPRSTSRAMEVKPYVVQAQRDAITNDLRARGIKNFRLAQNSKYPGQWVLSFPVKCEQRVLVCVIDEEVDRIKDIIVDRTSYPNYSLMSSQKEPTLKEIIERGDAYDHFVLINRVKQVEALKNDWLHNLLSDSSRKDIAFVVGHASTQDMYHNLECLLSRERLQLIKQMDSSWVTKHLYKTARYNLNRAHGRVIMIELKKLKKIQDNSSSQGITLLGATEHVSEVGFRNIHSPLL